MMSRVFQIFWNPKITDSKILFKNFSLTLKVFSCSIIYEYSLAFAESIFRNYISVENRYQKFPEKSLRDFGDV